MAKNRIKQKRFYSIRNIDKIPQLKKLSAGERFAMRVVAQVLPFRTNNYIVENLIDWGRVPDDPIFRRSPRAGHSAGQGYRRRKNHDA